MGETFTVRIMRFDPGRDERPCWGSYTVEAAKKPTLLELLQAIYREQDGGISFRCSCAVGKCGACAVKINGRRALACRHVVRDRELTVEPVAGFPVIKDLVVALDQDSRRAGVPGKTGKGGEGR